MHRFTKILVLTLALVLVVSCFAACGENNSAAPANNDASANNDAPATTAAPAGATQTWGNITVLVPDGFTLDGGSMFDDNSADDLTLTGSGLNYFQISILENEDSAKDNLDMTKSFNEEAKPEDVTVSANGAWTGVYYNSYGYDCFQVYATVNGKVVQVNGCGYKPDSATAVDVLSSITVQ